MYTKVKSLSLSLLFALVAFLSASIAAEANVLKDLLEAAQRNDDQLLIAESQFEAAKAGVSQGLAPVLPQLTFFGRYAHTENSCTGCRDAGNPDVTGLSGRIELSQSLYEPVKIGNYRMSRVNAERLGYELAVANYNLFTRLIGIYLDILTEHDRLRTLAAQRERLANQLRGAQTRFAAGTMTAVDVNEFTANEALISSQEEFSRINLITFYGGLSASFNINIRNLPPIKADFRFAPLETYDPDYWLGVAERNNYSLKSAEAAIEMAKASLRISRSERIPDFDAFAAYSLGNNQFSGFSTDTSQFEIGLRFNVPIYQGGQHFARARSARARLEEANHRRDLILIDLRTRIPSLVRQIAEGEDLIAASGQLLAAREAVVAQTEITYAAGATDITDLLLAYERLYEAERSYFTSIYNYVRNYTDFYVQTAQLDEESINQFYDLADLTNYDPGEIRY